jgi:hypothetical protein
MINENLFGVVKNSILIDRNCTNGVIIKQIITEKCIQITIKDNGDEIQVKRDTKENLKTYWNVTMMNDYHTKKFIEENYISFTEFRITFETLIKHAEGEVDFDLCIEEALKIIADQKITSNESRSDKKHNSNKKHEEIHGEDDRETGDTEEEFLTEEEKKETQGEQEYSEEEKKEIVLNIILEKAPYKFMATELSEDTGFESVDCTRIALDLLEENKIIMQKKGKSGEKGIYGAILKGVTEA